MQFDVCEEGRQRSFRVVPVRWVRCAGQNPQSAAEIGDKFVSVVRKSKGLEAPDVPDDQ